MGTILRFLGSGMALAALVMMLLASVLPWGNLDVKTKLGPIPVTLNADVYEYGIDYEANLSGAGLLSGANIPSKLADKKVFLTGLGGFQETIGFVKGSSKEKVIYATSYTWPPPQNGTADVKLTTLVGTIPWWPVGLAQDVGVSVELTGAVNVSELKVVKITFELHRNIDGVDRYKVVYEASPGETLSKVGDKKTFWGKVTVDEDFGNFTILAKVELELKDTYGHSNKKSVGGYYELVPPPKDVRLWTMGADKTARLGMMVAAFPMSLSAVVILAIGAVLGLLGGAREKAARWAWKVCLAGAVLSLLAVVFYVLGLGALIELTGYTDWFNWNPQFYIAVGGAVLSAAPAVLLFLVRPPPPPAKRAELAKNGKPGGVAATVKPGSQTALAKPGGAGVPAKPAQDPIGDPPGKAAAEAPSPTKKIKS